MNSSITILSTKKLKPATKEMALQAGIDILEEDFISIRFIDEREPEKKLADLKEYIVFTSRQAVLGFLRSNEKAGIHVPAKKIFCLQGETKKAVEEIDGMEVVGTGKNARELALLISEQKKIKAVSFICGSRRRDELPDLLKKNKIKVKEWVVYDTLLKGKLITEPYQGVLFFSPGAAESFFQSNILQKGIPCFCIGTTTAEAVTEHTVNKVIIADDTTQESMIRGVEKYFASQLNMKRV